MKFGNRSAARLIVRLLLGASVPCAFGADPQLTSWLTAYAGKYARIYMTDTARTNGTSLTTWTNSSTATAQALPAYCGVQEVSYSSNWIYVRTTDLAEYTMGPWYNDSSRTALFIAFPTNQHVVYGLPRTTTLTNPPATKTPTYGATDIIGYFVNGVAMFDALDGWMWNGSSEQNGGGNYQWRRAAYPNEGVTMDPSNSHQQNTGEYHNHADPIALRYTLGDHVDFNPTTKLYSESITAPTKHSPILGWVRDGLPIYGPYGYSNPTNPASGIRRMISGYQLRNGQNGSDNITNVGRATLPAWMLRNNGNTAATGPAVNSTYPAGRYLQDYAYLGDLTNSLTGTNYQLGVDFDLNEYDVRWCVTPEFPQGTYAYFITIDAAGTPIAPWNVGMYFFGTPTGTKGTAISESVTNWFTGAPKLAAVLNKPTVKNGNVTLTWSATEGGTYRVESSADLNNWTTNATAVNATLNSGSYTNNSSDPARVYRVAQTTLASYDPVSTSTGSSLTSYAPGGSAARGSTVTVTITLPSSPPWPPAGAPISSVTLAGTINGTSISDSTQGTVIATFAIPANATTGAQNIVVTFGFGPTYTLTAAFTIN